MDSPIFFFVLAGLIIAVIIGSTIWANRREKSRIFSNTFSNRPPSTPINNVSHSMNNHEPFAGYSADEVATPDVEVNSSMEIQQEVESSLREIKISIPRNEQTNVEVQHSSGFMAELKQSSMQPQPQSNTYQAKEAITEEPQAPAATENQTLLVYVVAAEGQQFYGEQIVQCLEALGFQYGDYQIFHRHQHIGNSATPVIFSVANIMQPGIFELDKLNHFATIGLVMFMHLPSQGNDAANLKMMLQSAEHLANSLGGFVLTDRREIFDENSRLEYLNRLC